jgi:PTS system galactitol-specific IIC component
MGFMIAILLGIFAKYSVQETLILGVQGGTALTLFPMVAKLFMQALAPISDVTGEFMKKHSRGRNFFIGLDWPILAGCSQLLPLNF